MKPELKKLDLSKVNEYPYILAIWTDHADFVTQMTQEDLKNLLEVRAFGQEGEYRAYRDVLTQEEFFVRTKEGEKAVPANAYDENQYLDIDTARTSAKADGWIYATGGGRYHLPYDDLPDVHKLLLITRTYFKFDDGIAHKADWRLVGFAKEETYGDAETK